MRWAVLSDVHGNLEALQAVLKDLPVEEPEGIFFLGDAVGYGADPNECVRLLQERTDWIVAGNHDFAAVGLTDITYFNPSAKAAVLWTKEALSAENRAFLQRLPLVRRRENFLLVHATPNQPEDWSYIFSSLEAEAGFGAMAEELAFIGHSHRPLILARGEDGRIQISTREELTLERGVRYIINMGSVGQPRDGNPHAAYGIYDENSRRFLLKRIPYDISAAQKKILGAGLPPSLARRLSQGL